MLVIKNSPDEFNQRIPYVTDDYHLMSKFYKRYNKVDLERLALTTQRDAALEDNFELKRQLQAFLEGISVNEAVMRKGNPLMIVKGKHSLPPLIP
ncbi:hypothetical protein CXG81DRAFT_23214 [Caulochytrium protostelioides]|uniref:Uncharacterized protein n=1 Tax=Caulochytrium protostelioides TaxID=1555241 RepID=A0A4P9XEY2_9FUNG|nr:hypothetical protein CXG81DRAFT_23214 [Caulochytrium protostelioides]|eukprot:RKP04102.1 hypothetical protein CXG81DRAFT_23214 [Caulochytrium protostelioides]